MSKFNDNIVDYSKDFENFINAFEDLEDMAPFDNNLFKAIHGLFNDSIESNKKTLSNLDESVDKYYKNIKNKMTKYYEELDLYWENQELYDKHKQYRTVKRVNEEY